MHAYADSLLLMLRAAQIEDNIVEMRRKTSSRAKLEHKMHSQLKIIGGSVTGRHLVSSQGAGVTRPMMEKVSRVAGGRWQVAVWQAAGWDGTASSSFLGGSVQHTACWCLQGLVAACCRAISVLLHSYQPAGCTAISLQAAYPRRWPSL
jgi:hypothetical protein